MKRRIVRRYWDNGIEDYMIQVRKHFLFIPYWATEWNEIGMNFFVPYSFKTISEAKEYCLEMWEKEHPIKCYKQVPLSLT